MSEIDEGMRNLRNYHKGIGSNSMSEFTEGLCEILPIYAEAQGGLRQRRKDVQAILDLMCKHRGCERPPLSMDSVPCKWCGKEQP